MWWWTQHLLLAGRVGWLPLLPGAVLTGLAAVAFSAASRLWLPRMLQRSIERYGPLILFFATVAVGIAVGYVLARDEVFGRRRGANRPPSD